MYNPIKTWLLKNDRAEVMGRSPGFPRHAARPLLPGLKLAAVSAPWEAGTEAGPHPAASAPSKLPGPLGRIEQVCLRHEHTLRMLHQRSR